MEEWLDFLETYSPHLLHDLPWKQNPHEQELKRQFEGLWNQLRPAILYFMRFAPGQHTQHQLLETQKQLVEYGKMAEEVRFALTLDCCLMQ